MLSTQLGLLPTIVRDWNYFNYNLSYSISFSDPVNYLFNTKVSLVSPSLGEPSLLVFVPRLWQVWLKLLHTFKILYRTCKNTFLFIYYIYICIFEIAFDWVIVIEIEMIRVQEDFIHRNTLYTWNNMVNLIKNSSDVCESNLTDYSKKFCTFFVQFHYLNHCAVLWPYCRKQLIRFKMKKEML